MKKTFTLLLLTISWNVFAQHSQTIGTAINSLDITNINAAVLTGGDMFHDLQYQNSGFGYFMYNQQFEVPRGSGNHSLFSGALWIGGKDSQNNLYVASQNYRQGPNNVNYWPGPIGNIQGPSHTVKYDKIWKISAVEIQDHITNYNKPGYSMPPDIASWPGNGNTANGEAAQLAPFVDVNHDGIYSPLQGDYPKIKGDQALYLIMNDNGNIKQPISPAMNTEIHVMYYGYDNSAKTAVYNTLFSEYRIINRSTKNYHDFYAGLWMDFDLGNYNDDYVGCDTTTNRFFVYNGDNYDNDTVTFPPLSWQSPLILTNGYGLNPPVQSVMFVDQKMSHFLYYNNNNNAVNGEPHLANDFYNFLSGYWKNNSPVTYGVVGTNPNNAPATHMFAGDPVTGSGWSEVNTLTTPASNVPADRRGMGSIGPFNLNVGQELKFTVAYTYSRGTSNLNSVTQAHTDAQDVINFFRSGGTNNQPPRQAQPNLVLSPNPATNLLNIQLPDNFTSQQTTILITDNLGRNTLQRSQLTGRNLNLNIAALPKGIYQVSVTNGSQTKTSRLVKL